MAGTAIVKAIHVVYVAMFQFTPSKLSARSITPCEVTVDDVNGSSKLLVPGRVTSVTSIPQGAMSMPIKAEKLRGQPDVMQVRYFVVETKHYKTILLDPNNCLIMTSVKE